MSAPSTRTISTYQVIVLRSWRRSQGGFVVTVGYATTAVLIPSHGGFKLATAVCGPLDQFDPEMGELIARRRIEEDKFVFVCAETAAVLQGGDNYY